MSATITAISKIAPYFFRADWTGTPPYRVYRDGRLYSRGTTSAEHMPIQSKLETEPPIIEILEDGDVSALSPYYYWAVLQWRNQPNAVAHRIQQYIAGSWATIAQPFVPTGEPYGQYITTDLVDGTEYQFRVMAQDADGNLTAAESVTFTHVRYPAPPEIEIAFDPDTDEFVISEV